MNNGNGPYNWADDDDYDEAEDDEIFDEDDYDHD